MNSFRAKKRFGQHLLRYAEDARRIASLLFSDFDSLTKPPTIVEIGSGTGELTAALCELYPTAEIIGIEFDRDLLQALKKRFAGSECVRFVQEDIVKAELAKYGSEIYLIGNLPYNISSPIMQWTLEQRASLAKAVFMLQREVARRLCSDPNSKDWSSLAIQTQLRFDVTTAFDLAPDRFSPPPKVHSSVFTLAPRNTAEDFPDFDETTSEKFEKLVRQAFGSRRKTLANNLLGKYNISRPEFAEVLSALGFDERIRAEQLSITDFSNLLKALETDSKQ